MFVLASRGRDKGDKSGGLEREKPPLLWLLVGVVSALFLLLELLGLHGVVSDYTLLFLSLLVLGRFAYVAVTARSISVDLLMGIAGLVTWYFHAALEGLLVYLLYSFSELIEDWVEAYATRRIEGLRSLIPGRVLVRKSDGSLEEKGLDMVVAGDVVAVRPGETVPVDGVIVDGESLFDTSYVTGEPEPVRLGRGDSVVSGYINRLRLVYVKALRPPRESMLQLLVMEAEKSLERKSRLQRMLDRFSGPYTLLVLGVFGLAAAFLTPYRALAILLAGCPSAFIVSSNTATALTIAVLARRGVVARGGLALEGAARIRVLVFDKTGTLTLGRLRVAFVRPANGFEEKTLLEYAGAASKASIHPVAAALSPHSRLYPEEGEEYPGKGVMARINGRVVAVGSKQFLREMGVEGLPAGSNCGNGLREVLVAVDGVFAGSICLEEEVSSSAGEVVAALSSRGLRVVIASGDRVERVRRIAEKLGVDEYYGGLSPEDKKRLVIMLRERYGSVGFVGDGVNDVEALAEADTSIAVGGLRLVSSIADIVLPRGISPLPLVFEASKRYMSSIRAAFLAAIVIKLGVMALGVLGFLPLWLVVGLGDDGSTLASVGIAVSLQLGVSHYAR